MYPIPDLFSSQDTIYHYTRMSIALEHILFERKLRFTPRMNSKDPIENQQPFIFVGGTFSEDDEWSDSDNERDFIDALHKKMVQVHINTKQICFCMNTPQDSNEGNAVIPYEYCGFLKPRMWDQYGENYQGICFAFSKSKLLEHPNIFSGNVEYRSFRKLGDERFHIDINRLRSQGFKNHENEVLKRVKEQLFIKHVDYSGENEFRICLELEAGENSDLIDVSSALIGIVVAKNLISEFNGQVIEQYAEKYKLEVYYLSWSELGIKITTKSEWDRIKLMMDQGLKKASQKFLDLPF